MAKQKKLDSKSVVSVCGELQQDGDEYIICVEEKDSVEYYPLNKILPLMLGKIVNIPIWFTHSKSDQTVNVDSYTTATYNRLIAAGAKNVHFSLFENVSDTSGNYAGHVYDGHYSWIYTLNNECKLDFDGSPVKLGDKEVTIWEWLASQSK